MENDLCISNASPSGLGMAAVRWHIVGRARFDAVGAIPVFGALGARDTRRNKHIAFRMDDGDARRGDR